MRMTGVGGYVMLVAAMGLGNRRRERQRDQNDRGPEHLHESLRHHQCLFYPDSYRVEMANSRGQCRCDLGGKTISKPVTTGAS